MSRSYAISLKTPHATLGLPVSKGRQLEVAAKKTWIAAMAALTIFFVGMYLYQVNRAASKSFVLTSLEKQVDELETTVANLENESAEMQALANVEERLHDLGYVAVDRMEFVDVPRGYALAN